MSVNAAAKVFAIPELLENILLHLEDQQSESDSAAPEHRYCPTIQLFPLQRVNKSFKNSITGSIKLRRLMFLAPFESKRWIEACPWQRCAPISWLFSRLLDGVGFTGFLARMDPIKASFYRGEYEAERGQKNRVDFTIPSIIACNNGSAYDVDKIKDALTRFEDAGGAHPQASWRQIKVAWVDDIEEIEVSVEIGLASSRSWISNADSQALVWWDFTTDEKLGSVFDKWRDLVAKLVAHVAAAEKLRAKVAKKEASLLKSGIDDLEEANSWEPYEPGDESGDEDEDEDEDTEE